MGDFSYIIVIAITVLLVVLQAKKAFNARSLVKRTGNGKIIEKGKKTFYLSYTLAIVCLVACIVLLIVPFGLKDRSSYALLAWVLAVVFVTNGLNYPVTQSLYVTDREICVGNECINRKKISHIQEESGKPSQLVLTDGRKIKISEFQAEEIKKGIRK